MKKLLLVLALILSVVPVRAQRIPSSLENPASPELAASYYKAYKSYKSSYYGIGAGLGVAALGYGLLEYTDHRARMNPDPSGLNEGAGMVAPFEIMLSLFGLSMSVGFVGENLGARSRLDRLAEKNTFLNTPGENLDTWRAYRASCVHESSRKWMKISGITTCCLAGYTLAGVIGCNYSDSDFLYASTETAMWLGFASGATFLVSWAVNATSDCKLDVHPSLTSLPFSPRQLPGLTLSATF